MWFKKRRAEKQKQISLLENEQKERKIIDVVSDMVLLLEKKLAMACVEIDALKLRFKKKIPLNDEMEEIPEIKENAKKIEEIKQNKTFNTTSDVLLPENERGIKQGV